ncbi:MAG: RNA polymerase sigma factor [Candidatus Eremiobacteraeota bacterium]|nr:RNA polymerase sigma factor [Candidatus Eremiobacteraeota bacterium]MCW5868837.1 RNA polymerase sigma factor [Candidatus Eremiobacteraeota bacterium]
MIEELYEKEYRRVFATLVRLLGDFDLAEEAAQEAFTVAVERWAQDGVPSNPRAWLVSTGRFKAIDAIRRRARFDANLQKIAEQLEQQPEEDYEVVDDRLRLIFTCCHPAITPNVQIPLTLREVCGLKTEEIAAAFLTTPTTMAQRIVRGKAKIRGAGIPYKVPESEDLPERLESVLAVIYLVYNEGYSSLARSDLSQEAIRLARLLAELLPDPESVGLLALMLLQESRRRARTDENGDLILLDDQDRGLWDQGLIAEGLALVDRALTPPEVGAYALQAAISALHARAATPEDTDWRRIVALYDLLLRADPSPIIQLNRAVAVAMRDGAAAGISLIEGLLEPLRDYHLAHAALADMHRRLGQTEAARTAYEKALELSRQEPEQRFLRKRLAELSKTAPASRLIVGGESR